MSDAMIGLLMINGENDILERTLAHNAGFLDAFYVLDGTVPNNVSERICWQHPKCAGYTRDDQLPRPPYPSIAVCGYRKHLHDQAVADYGPDNWFVILHGDEVWTEDPRERIDPVHDGWIYQLPFFFPRAGEEWLPDAHPVDQLRWHLKPGYPEFRLFRGGAGVAYDATQRFNTKPSGIYTIGFADAPILHYLYRSPESQRARAATHVQTQFDPENYSHILNGDAVYWTDAMIDSYRDRQHFRELAYA